ncbi:MAG TPA: addiction module protein [Gemmataceae bacterium]|jgi:putative addiction module component (TIGR02574 family)
MDVATALKQTETWPVEDQIELVQRLWDRILDSGWRPELTDDLKAELDRRLDALDANPNDVVSWDEIERHVRRER